MNGRAIVNTLKQVYADGTPTGLTKANDPSDPDYIPPFYSDSCPIYDTTTTTTSTTTSPVLQYQFINDSIYRIFYQILDGSDVIRVGSLYPGMQYTTQFTNNSSQHLQISLPVANYIRLDSETSSIIDISAGYNNLADSSAVQSHIDTFGDDTITIGDKVILEWEADPSSLTCEQVDDGTTTTTSTSTTSTTTIPVYNPLRYVLHTIDSGISGDLNVFGVRLGVVSNLHSSDIGTPVNLLVNSAMSHPVLDGAWVSGNITNSNSSDYTLDFQMDLVSIATVVLVAGTTTSIRLPLSGSTAGSQIDILASIAEGITLEWEADPDSLTCETSWDGSGTTSTTTTTTLAPVEIDTLTSNITVPGPYITPPANNASCTISLLSAAPEDITFVIQQAIDDGLGSIAEFDATILSGDTSVTVQFNTGNDGNTPANSNPLLGTPCVLGYRCATPVSLDYNSLGCKVTANYAQLSGIKPTRITIKTYDNLDNLVDQVNFPIGVETIERVLLASSGYFTVDIDNTSNSSTVIVDVLLDGVFYDYFTTTAGTTLLNRRVPSGITMDSPHNIQIQLS